MQSTLRIQGTTRCTTDLADDNQHGTFSLNKKHARSSSRLHMNVDFSRLSRDSSSPRNYALTRPRELPSCRLMKMCTVLFLCCIMIEIPVWLTVKFKRHLFWPEYRDHHFLWNIATWAYLHSAILAWGVWLCRPKGRQRIGYRSILACFLLQSGILLAFWTYRIGAGSYGPRIELVDRTLLGLGLGYCVIVCPLVALSGVWVLRGFSVLLLAELVPLCYFVLFVSSGFAFVE